METKVKSSETTSQPVPHEGKIRAFTAVAWFCVTVGFLAILPGVCRLVSESNGVDKGQITLLNLSSFGSYLQGAVQSLWSLAAFLFIYVAFLGQKQQLKLQTDQFEIQQRQQKEQINQQQIELEDQRRQFRIQSDSIRRQDFENKFFQLLNLHHKLVEDMVDGSQTGRDCFKYWFQDIFRREYRSRTNPLNQPGAGHKYSAKQELEVTVECYNHLYEKVQGDLGHYFRNLYHLIKFVDEAQDIDDKSKKDYTTLVRAQLSSYEQALLFYNCIHPYSEEFYRLIEQYSLFHNFDDSLLLDETHEEYFDPKAYGSQQKTKRPNPRLAKILNPASDSKPA